MNVRRSCIVALLVCGVAASAANVPWSFETDFRNGFSGWMSYPLAQDIGFDPTLVVEPASSGDILVREVDSIGQRQLSIGFIRPLHFVADAETRIHLRYSAVWPSTDATLEIMLAGEDGHRYHAAVPASGVHEVVVTGDQFRLPRSGVPVEAIALLDRSGQPHPGAKNRIELHGLRLEAKRPAEPAMAAPRLVSDFDRTLISAKVVDLATGLPVQVQAPAKLTLTDPTGRRVVEYELKSGSQVVPLGAAALPGLWTARLESAAAAGEFFFLALGRVSPHPRVLLSPERLGELRSAANYASLRQSIHQQAQAQSARLEDAAAAGARIASLPPGRTLRPSVEGELNGYFELVESYSNAIAYNAIDYALNGDQTRLTMSKRDLLAVSRWPTWTPPRFAAHGMHTYYETGIMAQRLSFAYDLIAPTLSPAEKQEIADAFWTRCIVPTINEYFRYNRMPTGASNWMSNSLGGAIAAAVAVAGDLPGWRDREGPALAELLSAFQCNLHGLFPGDGSELEPAGYEHFAMQGISWAESALRAFNIRPLGTVEMLQGFRWPDYAMVRPNLVLDTGDFNGEFRGLSGFAFGAESGGIPALRAFYDRARRSGGISDLLDLFCCSRPASPVPGAPLSRVFPERGSAVLRSGWSSTDTVVSLRAGPWLNHEHHDQGSFQVAASGTRLIAEAGYASYYLDPNYPAYFTQAPGHNTVLVDGDAFSQAEYDGPFWKALDRHASFTSHLLAPEFDYIAANLAPAYAGDMSAYTRQYLFLAPDLLIVSDNLRAAHPHEFTFLLHAAPDTTVKADGAHASIVAGGAVADIVAAGSGANWEMRAMPQPASKPQILGNVVLHPREQPNEPHRYALALSSVRSPGAHFEVAMHFRNHDGKSAALATLQSPNATGFSAASDAWALFRTETGKDLAHGGLSSDGAVFAGRTSDHWIAIAARTVSHHRVKLLIADNPANVAWSASPEGIAIDLHLNSPGGLVFRAPRIASDIILDGKPVRVIQQNGYSKLPSLSRGDHHVWIAARAAA